MHEVICHLRISRHRCSRWQAIIAILLLATTASMPNAIAQSHTTNKPQLTTTQRNALDQLVRAYPDSLLRIDGTDLVWRDGTRMPVSDGKRDKTAKQRLQNPDILDMLHQPYVPGPPSAPPQKDDDPGRARNAAFFEKLYGDCRRGGGRADLVTIKWLPKSSGQHLKMTKRHGAAARLQAISDELDTLPAKFQAFLTPAGGTYNCRTIAGTKRLSAHGYAIAIDINVKHSNYWRWSKPDATGTRIYQNSIPWEIVAIFEKHGFIWGGKWYHFDTMHFEYRPELLAPGAKAMQ